MTSAATPELVDRLFREESGRAVATLIRQTGDFDIAEEYRSDWGKFDLWRYESVVSSTVSRASCAL